MNTIRTNPSPAFAPRAWLLLFAASCIPCTACSHGDRMSVTPVRGRVFAAPGKPAAGALVIFHPVDTNRDTPLKPLAYVDKNGDFQLTTYEQGDGAPIGEYVITVEWREKVANPFSPEKEGKDRLGGKYADPDSSEFRFAVDGKSEEVVPAIYLE